MNPFQVQRNVPKNDGIENYFPTASKVTAQTKTADEYFR